MYIDTTKKLIEFLNESTDCFHTTENIRKILTDNGFYELSESKSWELQGGKKYFVIRNMSSVLAFKMPDKKPEGIMLAATHSDSPSFKIKPNAEMESENHYLRLNTEGYGGAIDFSWLDRPLSVSGRICVKNDSSVDIKLINIDRDMLIIPSLAIHMNRDANKGYEFNHQRDMIPLFGSEKGQFLSVLAQCADVCADDITGYDLFLYNREKGCIWGADNEYFSAPRIDDLQCSYAVLNGFIKAEKSESLQMFAILDNEEVGSSTKQGAKSDFLLGVLERIYENMGFSREDYRIALSNGFMVSADNGHAVHPNHADKSDPTNRIYMNDGIVIKYNANQSYTTDAVSESIFKAVCEKADVPYQEFTNRSDMRGGSTLGNLANNHVSLNSVDIGLAQLSMHSSYETAGVRDTKYLIDAMKVFFETVIVNDNNKIILKK